jgi:spermidine synthase
VPHLRKAAELRPQNPQTQYRLGVALASAGQPLEALEHLRTANRLRENWPAALRALAWILATHADERIRRPDEAVQLAELAAELTARRDALVLDTLAAAYAASGRFDQAIQTAERALEMVSPEKRGRATEPIRRRLDGYRQRRAYYSN